MENIQKNIDEFKNAIEKEMAEIVEELQTIAHKNPEQKNSWETDFPSQMLHQSNTPITPDESADEVEEYEVRLETKRALQDRLAALQRALKRMENGIYGKCVACGGQIPLERLRANPAAEYDTEHEPSVS